MAPAPWPALPYAAFRPTLETLQLWTQIAGKIRLAHTPWLNHAWHATLYVSARGLTTGLIPHPTMPFEIAFDLLDSQVLVQAASGAQAQIPLGPGSIAQAFTAFNAALADIGAPTAIDTHPNELEAAIPFPQDCTERAYDPAAAQAFWRALVDCTRVFTRFRSRFVGKCSPVHFFWGSFDLAVTRFSGRRAPLHPGGVPHLPDAVAREAYSHEVSSAGFWPGGGAVPEAAFYSYCYPAPAAFAAAAVQPAQAQFNATLGEFILPYEAVRTAPDPDEALLAFLQSTYEAAATSAGWDRAALEIPEGRLGHPRPVS